MNLVLLGLNHRTAPIAVRERVAISEARLPEATRRLAEHPGVAEAMIVSTCNRTELLAHSGNSRLDLRSFATQYFGSEIALDPHLYEFRDADAVRHLFRVASSLDSMVVGEPQILGQVKNAYAVARAVGAVNSQLDALVTRAFSVAKRVRTETAIGSSAVSIASVAVELAKKIFGSLHSKTVYLVGAAKMSELAARHLLANGAAKILVSNRTHERAVALAATFGGEAIPFEQLYSTVDRADVVISSTGAPHAIFRREHGEAFLARRKNRPMFFIDIAVPRDVDPEMNRLDGIFVYDIDDLQSVVLSNAAERKREAERAEQIIAAEVERFVSRVNTLEVVPTIVSLQEHLENIRQAELDRARGRLGPLNPDQETAVEAMTRAMMNKVLHTPMTALKAAVKGAQNGDATHVVELVRRLFNLEVAEKAEAAGQENEDGEKADSAATSTSTGQATLPGRES
jgi:glutamyl-tRNA reductase